jgi:hypothetical protein
MRRVNDALIPGCSRGISSNWLKMNLLDETTSPSSFISSISRLFRNRGGSKNKRTGAALGPEPKNDVGGENLISQHSKNERKFRVRQNLGEAKILNESVKEESRNKRRRSRSGSCLHCWLGEGALTQRRLGKSDLTRAIRGKA